MTHHVMDSYVPVRNLFKRQLLVTLKKNGHVMSNHSNQKGDEDDGQHDPKSDIWVQQKLRFSHAAW